MKRAKIVIQHGIQLPEPGWAKRVLYLPFEKMKVGDHFVVPLEGIQDAYRVRSYILGYAREYRAMGWRFATRLMPKDSGIGCWRIK